MSEPLKILVTGCRGRMGEAVARCAGLDAEVTVSGKIDAGDDLPVALAGCDAVVDFSHHTFTRDLVTACRDQGKLLVIGTTGLSAETESFIRGTSQTLPIVFAPNYSVGVNTLFWLTRKATEILGADFDLEVVEMHHNKKIDAPSGTALLLGQAAAQGRQVDLDNPHTHHDAIELADGRVIKLSLLHEGQRAECADEDQITSEQFQVALADPRDAR